MAWPTSVNTTNLDSATDSPAAARADLLAGMTAINDIIASRAAASGIASLDASSRIPTAQMPTTISTSTLNVTPTDQRLTVLYVVSLGPRSTAQLAAYSAQEGDIAYCSDGDAGDPCLAVHNGTSWLRVSLGTAISST